MGVERLTASLTRLQDALEEVRLPLELPGVEDDRELIRAQSGQIEDYVLPRLRRLDAPLLAVVGGSTGAGKSTLVNTMIGRKVTESGVIRPTTRSSVLIHHPDDARWFESSLILPGLARSEVAVTDPRVLQMVPEPTMPKGLAILDAPDVDSVVAENRTLAAQLLAAADLWLFVTSAARYADAVPWEYLRSAAGRKAVVAVVLDRVPPAAMSDVPPHLGQMMSQRGLSSSPLFAVPETGVNPDGLLPDAAVRPIRGWLADLAEDTVRRNQVVLQTLDGAIESLAAHTPQIISALAGQREALDTLRADAEKSFAEAVRSVAVQTADGTLLRGEVLARWQDFVGTGELFRAVEKRIGLFRDRMVQVAKGEPKKAQEVQLAVGSGLELLISEEGEFAARRVVSAWEAHPAGRQLLSGDGALGRVSSDFSEAAARVIRDWQGDVLELVGEEGKSKKAAARYLALGVNGAGVALMVFVFSQTGGLAGAELGVAGGTAVLAQRVLEAVFGEDAVRRLAKEAKRRLDSRVEALMALELSRFAKLIDEFEVSESQAEQLAAAVAGVETERSAHDRYVREVTSAPGLPDPETATYLSPATQGAWMEAESASFSEDQAEPDGGGESVQAEPDARFESPEVGPEASAEVSEFEQAHDGVHDLDQTESSAQAPQRFVSGDTGLLPVSVSAELSDLAAEASVRAEDGDDAEPAEGNYDHRAGDGAEPGDDAEPGEQYQTELKDDELQVLESAVPFEANSEELDQPDRSDSASSDSTSSDSANSDSDSSDSDSSDSDNAEEAATVEDSDWHIPVPPALAELAAEAVRRPSRVDSSPAGERAADAGSAQPEVGADDGQSDNEPEAGDAATDGDLVGAPAALPSPPGLPAAPQLPNLPVAPVVVGSGIASESAKASGYQSQRGIQDEVETQNEPEDRAETGTEGSESREDDHALGLEDQQDSHTEVGPNSALPAPPSFTASVGQTSPPGGLPLPPQIDAGSHSDAGSQVEAESHSDAETRSDAGSRSDAGPAPLVLPAAPAVVTVTHPAVVGADEVPLVVLIPPAQIPPPPPVPQWPAPEADQDAAGQE